MRHRLNCRASRATGRRFNSFYAEFLPAAPARVELHTHPGVEFIYMSRTSEGPMAQDVLRKPSMQRDSLPVRDGHVRFLFVPRKYRRADHGTLARRFYAKRDMVYRRFSREQTEAHVSNLQVTHPLTTDLPAVTRIPVDSEETC
jgi:hypothetical protein